MRQLLRRLLHLPAILLQRPADPYRSVIPQKPFDLPGDHGNRIGGKLYLIRQVKFIDRLDQTDRSDLKQILHLISSSGEPFYDMMNQSQIFLYQYLSGLPVTFLCPCNQH